MILALRQLARSRRLHAIGVLAWLLLVFNAFAGPAPGVPERARTPHSHAAAVTPDAQIHRGMPSAPSHAACDLPDGCCGTPAAHACQCPAMGGGVLSSTAPAVPGAVALAVVYARVSGPRAPSPATTAPLRPPAA